MSAAGSWAVKSLIVAALVCCWRRVGQPESRLHQQHTWTGMTGDINKVQRCDFHTGPSGSTVRNLHPVAWSQYWHGEPFRSLPDIESFCFRDWFNRVVRLDRKSQAWDSSDNNPKYVKIEETLDPTDWTRLLDPVLPVQTPFSFIIQSNEDLVLWNKSCFYCLLSVRVTSRIVWTSWRYCSLRQNRWPAYVSPLFV